MLNCCGMMQLRLFSCGVLLDDLRWVNLASFGSRWSLATESQMLMDSNVWLSCVVRLLLLFTLTLFVGIMRLRTCAVLTYL